MRLIWLSGTSAVLLFGAIAFFLAPLNPSVLALQLSFSARTFGEIIHNWTPEQLQLYRNHFPFDFALLVTYGSFGYLLATITQLFLSFGSRFARVAKWCLPLGAACDATENIFHLWLTAAPRFGVPSYYVASASFSLTKWASLVLFGCLVIYALAKTEA